MVFLTDSSGVPSPNSDVISGFSRRHPAVAAAFAPSGGLRPDVKARVEGHLTFFLTRASRFPACSTSEALAAVSHEADMGKIICGELCKFPDDLEPAVNDTTVRIGKMEPRGRNQVKDLALYCLARLARLYRLEVEGKLTSRGTGTLARN